MSYKTFFSCRSDYYRQKAFAAPFILPAIFALVLISGFFN